MAEPSRHDFEKGGYALVSRSDTFDRVRLGMVDEDMCLTEFDLTPAQAVRLGRYLIAAARRRDEDDD